MRVGARLILASAAMALTGLLPAVAETMILSTPKETYRAIAKREADKAGLPPDVADAVMAIESGYDPTRVGGVGEIGLMQVRPTTAAMLGFQGTAAELALPETNIHYGVTYLAKAWQMAGGDFCRALMKYRAGHGEEVMSPLSAAYCDRARRHLAGEGEPNPPSTPRAARLSKPSRVVSVSPLVRLSSVAFWAAHDARVKAISARIERKWRMMAAR